MTLKKVEADLSNLPGVLAGKYKHKTKEAVHIFVSYLANFLSDAGYIYSGIVELESSLHTLDISPLTCDLQYCLPVCGLSFHFNSVTHRAKII